MTDALLARRAALAILDHVTRRKLQLEEAVDAAFRTWKPEGLDRSFARALATTVLRHRGFLDRILKRFIERSLDREAGYAPNVLRAGMAQILFMAVPDHAAVDTSVSILSTAKSPADRKLKGLTNAVLRRVATERAALLAELGARPGLSLPPPVYKRWRAAYGEPRTQAIAGAMASEPPLDLSLRHSEEAEHLAQSLGAMILPTGGLRLGKGGDVTELSGFESGAFWVQDAAAALPARLLLPASDCLDLCAAPGGKTLQLAAQGVHVTALDRSAARLERLKDNLARTGLAAEIVVGDALIFRPERPVSHILLDAPCSASGTARRHPDVLWAKKPGDIERLAALQAKLLAHAADLLAPGGRLVYCVCSLEPEEGEQQIEALLAARPDFRRVGVRAEEMPGLEQAILESGDVRTLPDMWADIGGLDGFYISRLERLAA